MVLHLFPYSLGEVSFNWYVNFLQRCIEDWDTFEKLFLKQFKTFLNPAMLHQQFMSIKKDPAQIISCFNHCFYMAYHKLQSPYNIPVEATIQIYLNALDHLTTIFLRRLPPTNIDTLERVFSKGMTFTKEANPNKGGLMFPAQAITIVLTYLVRVPTMPS